MKHEIIKTLQGKTVLITATRPEIREELAGIFQRYGSKAILAASESDTFDALSIHSDVDFIVMDVETSISRAFPFVRTVRAAVPELPPVFLVCDRIDAQLEAAFYEGCEAVFVRPLEADEFAAGVAISYEALMEHCARRYERRRIRRARVVYTTGNRSISVLGYATNIAFGGMFIGSMHDLPAIDDKVKFKLIVESESVLEFTGEAVVRWVRPALIYGRPRGFGIEFLGVDKEILRLIGEAPPQVAEAGFDSKED